MTIVVPANHEATDIEGFLECLDRVDRSSIYFHCFEARLRLGREKDDFSEWLATSMDREDIAERIRCLDAYMYDLDTLRKVIRDIVAEEIE